MVNNANLILRYRLDVINITTLASGKILEYVKQGLWSNRCLTLAGAAVHLGTIRIHLMLRSPEMICD